MINIISFSNSLLQSTMTDHQIKTIRYWNSIIGAFKHYNTKHI